MGDALIKAIVEKLLGLLYIACGLVAVVVLFGHDAAAWVVLIAVSFFVLSSVINSVWGK